jgi:glycosyltransferase involved in cell wall biosynthesis
MPMSANNVRAVVIPDSTGCHSSKTAAPESKGGGAKTMERSMRSKLCIVVPTHWEAEKGGSQYQAKVLTEYLLKHYDVDITYLTTESNPSFDPQGYRIVQFSDRNGIRRYGTFFDAFRLYNALRKERPDAILQFVGSAHTGIAALYARVHGSKMIWRVTDDASVEPEIAPWWHLHKHVERWSLRFGVSNAELILAQTRYQRDQIARHFCCNHVRVIPSFQPTVPARSSRPWFEAQVAWIGTIKPCKNPGAFIRLARQFAGRKDIRFVMVGSTTGEDAWTREQLAAMAATPNIEYLGACSEAAVNRLLERADLLVNTSDRESFSNTFIQAWMRRVPVVSLNVDPDGLLSRRGLGVVSRTEDQLFRQVTTLLHSYETRAEIGTRARAYVLDHHTERNIEEIARLLQVARPPAVMTPQLV